MARRSGCSVNDTVISPAASRVCGGCTDGRGHGGAAMLGYPIDVAREEAEVRARGLP